MSDYTPTTEEVRSAYSAGAWFEIQTELEVHETAFDRWLAEVKAKAWAEGAQAGFAAPRRGALIVNPYPKGAQID